MNYEEAKTCIEHLEWLKAEIEWDKSIGYQTDIDVAIEALEKQIPKKPIYDGHTYACPNCKTILLFKNGEIRGNGCKWCLQAIDWSDAE